MSKRIMIGLAGLLLMAGLVVAETKYNAGATAAGAKIVFKASGGGWAVKAISAVTGSDDKEVKVYARDISNNLNPYAISARVEKTNTITNTGLGINTNDLVVYQSKNGVAEIRTATTGTSATQVVLDSEPSTTFSTSDKLYKVVQVGSWNIGITNTAGKAVLAVDGDALAKTPKDSPLYVHLDGATNSVLTVTAQ